MGALLQQDWAGGLASGPQKVDIGKNGISCKPPGCTLNVSGCGTYPKYLIQKYPSHLTENTSDRITCQELMM